MRTLWIVVAVICSGVYLANSSEGTSGQRSHAPANVAQQSEGADQHALSSLGTSEKEIKWDPELEWQNQQFVALVDRTTDCINGAIRAALATGQRNRESILSFAEKVCGATFSAVMGSRLLSRHPPELRTKEMSAIFVQSLANKELNRIVGTVR